MKTWRFLAIFWPILCVIFAVFMGFQSGRTLDSRISGIGFCTIPLIFFAIGMSVRHRLLKERSSATALTTAVVVSQGRRLRTGKNPAFFPEYEFHAGETLYRVTAPSGSGFHMSEGTTVDLYYAPENPRIFYVPMMHRYESRVSTLLCGIGMVLPVLGLFSPQIEAFLYSLG